MVALNSLLGISVKHKNAQTIRECFRMLIMIAGELGKYTASHKRLCNASAAHVALVVFDDMCPTPGTSLMPLVQATNVATRLDAACAASLVACHAGMRAVQAGDVRVGVCTVRLQRARALWGRIRRV